MALACGLHCLLLLVRSPVSFGWSLLGFALLALCCGTVVTPGVRRSAFGSSNFVACIVVCGNLISVHINVCILIYTCIPRGNPPSLL